jgi:hypothetical protein
MSTCISCNVDFVPIKRKSQQKFCSARCYKKWWARKSRGWRPVTERTCVICRVVFLPDIYHPKSETCSKICNKKNNYRKHRAERMISQEIYNASHKKERALQSRRWRRKNPEKAYARSCVSNAMAQGRLVRPKRCSHCGKKCKPEAHHCNGYDRPLDIVWICFDCHRELHLA